MEYKISPSRIKKTISSFAESLTILNFRIFFYGQLISLTGSWAQIIAQDWLVLELTNNSATALGIVTALQFLPSLFFTFYAGVLADRFPKRRLLVIIISSAMVIALMMGTIITLGLVELWHVYIFAFTTGMFHAFEKPTRQAFTPEMVGKDLLRNAVSLNAATFNATRLIGPALGGATIALLGVGPTFLLNGASFIAVLIGLAMIKKRQLHVAPKNPEQRKESVREQMSHALRFIRARRDVVLIMAMGFVVGMFAMNLSMSMALSAKVEFGASAAGLGVFTSALAVGALIGALLGARGKQRPSAERQLGYAAALGVSVMLLAAIHSYWVMAAALVLVGSLLIGHNVTAQARLQLGVSSEMRGRVGSVYLMLFFGPAPLGAAMLGVVGDLMGPSGNFLVIGVAVLSATTLFAVVRWYAHGVRILMRLNPYPHLRIIRPDMPVMCIPSQLPGIAR